MIGYIMFGLVLVLSIMKFYKNRTLFKQFSKKEWLQYIVVFLFAWLVAAIIIIGGAKLKNSIQTGWVNDIVAIIIILMALTSAGFIMNKLVPEKLKAFYT